MLWTARIRRSFKVGAIIFGVLAICLVPVIFLVDLGMKFASNEGSTLALILNYLFVFVVAAGLVIGFLIFLLFKPLFLVGYYVARGKKLKEGDFFEFERVVYEVIK